MPSGLTPNRPRTPGRIRAAVDRIVRTLAIGVTDRMNRRQVHNIETKIAKLWQSTFGVLESSRLGRFATLRSHKHLVPGSEASFLTIDDQLEKRFESRHAKSLP